MPGDEIKDRLNAADQPLLVLEAGRADSRYWADLWRYRELFAILAWRDVSVRYKQTVIGFAWAVIRPFLTMVVFTVIFGRIAAMPSVGGAPYAIIVFAGTLPWFLFASILSEGSNSLVSNASLVGKVYFPRLIIPVASVVVAVIDFAVSLVVFAIVMVWFGYVPSARIVLLPIFIVAAALAALGPALLLCSLTVRYRDFRHIIPFFVQFGLYISPVGFASDVIPAGWRVLYGLNPMVGVIDGFRWCVIEGANLHLPSFAVSMGMIVLLAMLGLRSFRRAERSFADVI